MKLHPPRVLALLLAAAIMPQCAFGAAGQQIGIEIGATTFYDDNVLQYSQDQIDLFLGGTRPDRFSISTSDDAVLQPSVALSWDVDRGDGRRHHVRLKGGGSFHQKNGTADFRSVSLAARESFRNDWALSLYYYYLPGYYLRQLFDDEAPVPYPRLSKYRRAEFDLQIASAGWQIPVTRRTRAELTYQFENRKYVVAFRDRDSGLHLGKLDLSWRRRARGPALDLFGGYRVSHARGADGLDPPGLPPDDPDVSFHGFEGGIGGSTELWRRASWRLGADLSYVLETRTFTSDRLTDRFHYHRKDLLQGVEVGVRALRRPHWSMRGFYRFENNRADFGVPAPASSTDAGKYRQNQVGVAVEWSGTLWSRLAQRTPDTSEE